MSKNRYELRTEDGTLVFKPNPDTAVGLTTNAKGSWREYRGKDEPACSCFVFSSDYALNTQWGTLMIWAGFKLIDRGVK